jgi:ankyrin repeat protein
MNRDEFDKSKNILFFTKTRFISIILLFAAVSVLAVTQCIASGTSLHDAVHRCDIKKVDALLNQKADVNVKDDRGRTPLMWASFLGQTEIARRLLKQNPNLNDQDNDGDTALIIACGNKNTMDVINLLLAKGADMRIRDNNGDSAFLVASGTLYTNAVPMRLLISKGADVNEANNSGDTALMNLAKSSLHLTLPIMKFILSKGARVNERNDRGKTALKFASENCGYYQAVKLLLENNANPNLADDQGNTPLMAAAGCGDTEAVKQLIAKGAHVSVTNSEGKTAQRIAIDCGNKDIAERLR